MYIEDPLLKPAARQVWLQMNQIHRRRGERDACKHLLICLAHGSRIGSSMTRN